MFGSDNPKGYGKYLGLMLTAAGMFLIIMMLFDALAPIEMNGIMERTENKQSLDQNSYRVDKSRNPGDTKNITLYLHNYTATVPAQGDQKIMNSSFPHQMGYVYQQRPNNAFTIHWYLKPEMAGPLTINGTIKMRIYMEGSGGNNFADLTFTLYNYSGGVDDQITTDSLHVDPIHSGINPYFVETTTSPYKLSKDSYLHLKFDLVGNSGGGTSGNDWTVYWGNQSYPSLITLECQDHIEVEEAWSEDYTEAKEINFDPNADNKTIYVRSNISDPFGGDDISWVNATIISPSGDKILEYAPMNRIAGGSNSLWNIYNMSWNYSGNPTGVYTVEVYAVDNTGYYYRFPANPGDETFGGHLETYRFQFTLGESVYANLLAQDSKERPLVGADVIIRTGSGTVVASGQTNSSGMDNFTLVSGPYEFFVMWEDVIVYNKSINIDDNWTFYAPLYLNCSVHDAELLVVDALHAPMEDASLYVTHPNGSTNRVVYKTNSTGHYALDLTPGGNYTVRVLWRDVLVNKTGIEVKGNETYQINCSVFELNIHAADTIGENLTGAQVVVTNVTSGIVFDSQITNDTGNITSQLPIGNYTIDIYWQETLVYHDPGYLLIDNGAYNAKCEVFYLNITAVDSRDELVVGAQVVVTTLQGSVLDSQVTDTDGKVETRLPAGTLSLSIYWQDILVNQTSGLTITGNTPITANCSIYYLELTTLDSHYSNPEPLAYSRLTLSISGDPVVFTSTEANSQGRSELRLPAGSYDINVYWMDVLVYSETGYSLNETTQTATLECNVFYLNVTAKDNKDHHLEDARISFYLQSSGRLLAEDKTTETEGFTVRLPGTTYDVRVIWQEVVVGEEPGFSLDDNGDLEIHCRVFYLDMRAVDTHGVPVSQAAIEIAADQRTLAVGTTDEQGSYSARLPGTPIDINVLWQDHLVNHTENLYLDEALADSGLVINCDIYYLTIELLDSDKIPVEKGVITVHDSDGKILGTGESEEDGLLITRLPKGNMDITVTWKGVVVGIENDYFVGSVIDPELSIDCSIYYLSITAVDDEGTPLQDATVDIRLNRTGRLIFSGISNLDGQAIARLPSESYDIQIRWKEVKVFSEYDYHLTDESDEELVAFCSVYYITFTLTDVRGMPVSDATVAIELGSTSVLLDTGTTNSSGTVVLRLPGSKIDITVAWKTVTVNETKGCLLTEKETIDVFCSIYYLKLKAVDSLGEESLAYAQFGLYLENGELMSSGGGNLGGEAEFRLPAANYYIDVTWQDVLVLEDFSYNFTGNDELTLGCKVYYLTLKLVDLEGEPVELATAWVEVNDTGRTLGKWQTDLEGSVEFRLPVNSYDIFVTWHGHPVYSQEGYDLNGNVEETIVCNIYYLSITCLDSRDEPLPDSMIAVRSGLTGSILVTAETDDEGKGLLRLPEGDLDIEVQWRDVLVYHVEGYALEGTTADVVETYHCRVYYLELGVVDSRDVPVVDALVSVSRVESGSIFGTYNTDGNGSLVSRFPQGEYQVTTIWMDIMVNTTTHRIEGDDELTLSARVYYMTLDARDVDNISVANAEVTAIYVDNGIVYFSGTTDENGRAVARLPVGTYDISARWMGVLVENINDHSVKSDHTLDVNCDIYYLSVTVTDKENQGIGGVYIEIKNEEARIIATSKTDDQGASEFRLPVGKYTIHARLRATYEMTPVDDKLVSTVELTESRSLGMKYKNYPLSFQETGTFSAITSSIIIIVLIILLLFFLISRLKKRKEGEVENIDLEKLEKELDKEEEEIFEEEGAEDSLGDVEAEDEILEEEAMEEELEPESFEEIADQETGGEELDEDIDEFPSEIEDSEEMLDAEDSKEVIE